jgi:hypothetical protein
MRRVWRSQFGVIVITDSRVGGSHNTSRKRCGMPILIMGAMALGIFGVIGILLFTASMLETHNKKTRL